MVGECLESHLVYDSNNEQDNEELSGIDIYYALFNTVRWVNCYCQNKYSNNFFVTQLQTFWTSTTDSKYVQLKDENNRFNNTLIHQTLYMSIQTK